MIDIDFWLDFLKEYANYFIISVIVFSLIVIYYLTQDDDETINYAFKQKDFIFPNRPVKFQNQHDFKNNENSLGIRCVTENGEQVKSKAEKKIADYFYYNDINYVYEKPIYYYERQGYREKQKTIRPDFYLPDFDIYVEYWGLIEFPEYVKKMSYKENVYRELEIKHISIYPSQINELEKWLGKYRNMI